MSEEIKNPEFVNQAEPSVSTVEPANVSTAEPAQKDPSGKNLNVLWIVFGVVLVVVLGMLAYILLKSSAAPAEVRVTNVTGRSATISWRTEGESPGVVLYSEDDNFLPWILAGFGKDKAYDDRDVSAARLEAAEDLAGEAEDNGGKVEVVDVDNVNVKDMGDYYVHHVTIIGLEPETTYYFMVGDGFKFTDVTDVLVDDEFNVAAESNFTTHQDLEDILVPDPAYGRVVLGDKAVDDGIMFMRVSTVKGSEPASTLLNESGNWYIDLSNMRSGDGNYLVGMDEDTGLEHLYVMGGDNGNSEIIDNHMYLDAPAMDIDLLQAGELEEESSSSNGNQEFVSYVFAGDGLCDGIAREGSTTSCVDGQEYIELVDVEGDFCDWRYRGSCEVEGVMIGYTPDQGQEGSFDERQQPPPGETVCCGGVCVAHSCVDNYRCEGGQTCGSMADCGRCECPTVPGGSVGPGSKCPEETGAGARFSGGEIASSGETEPDPEVPEGYYGSDSDVPAGSEKPPSPDEQREPKAHSYAQSEYTSPEIRCCISGVDYTGRDCARVHTDHPDYEEGVCLEGVAACEGKIDEDHCGWITLESGFRYPKNCLDGFCDLAAEVVPLISTKEKSDVGGGAAPDAKHICCCNGRAENDEDVCKDCSGTDSEWTRGDRSDSQSNLDKLISKTHAQGDTDDYIITDDIIVTPGKDGVYDIVIPGKGEALDVRMVEGQEYLFFMDDNGNGIREESEEVVDVSANPVELAVDPNKTVFTLDVSAGLSFVSFEYLPSEMDSCKIIVDMNEQSDEMITQIARFESGRFEVTKYRRDIDDAASGDCFPVVSGRGYVLRTYADEELILDGYELTAPAEVAFDVPGWHLVGINGTTSIYTAEGVIDSIDSVDGLDADNVTHWQATASKYEGLQKEADTGGTMQVYGFDYPIETGQSYFVRIISGSGIWTPE